MRVRYISWLLSWSLLSVEVHAQPKSPKGQEAKATQLMEEAQTYYNLLEYHAALEAFKEAYSLSRDPALLFYLGQCYDQLGQPDKALVSYQTYLEVGPEGPLRLAVSALIEQHQDQLTPANIAANLPQSTPTTTQDELKGQPSRAPFLYGGALAGVVLGGVVGAVALSARLRAAQLAIEETSPEAFFLQSRQARRLGLASDLLLLGGLTSGAAAYLVKPSPYTNKLLFGGAAFTGVLGMAAGVVALSAAQRSKEGPAEEARFQAERARVFSRSADLFFVSAVASGGLGLWLSLKKDAGKQLTLLPASNGVALFLEF